MDSIEFSVARPPHTKTGLATRPVARTAPKLPTGLNPDEVAARIVTVIKDGEKDLPVEPFTTSSLFRRVRAQAFQVQLLGPAELLSVVFHAHGAQRGLVLQFRPWFPLHISPVFSIL